MKLLLSLICVICSLNPIIKSDAQESANKTGIKVTPTEVQQNFKTK